MLLVTYDISDTKKRTKFAKCLEKYGNRVQYSVFRVKNSQRILNNLVAEIKNRFEKDFSETDSIYIFHVCKGCSDRVHKFGYATYEDENVVHF